jgi:hypothetical protein
MKIAPWFQPGVNESKKLFLLLSPFSPESLVPLVVVVKIRVNAKRNFQKDRPDFGFRRGARRAPIRSDL